MLKIAFAVVAALIVLFWLLLLTHPTDYDKKISDKEQEEWLKRYYDHEE